MSPRQVEDPRMLELNAQLSDLEIQPQDQEEHPRDLDTRRDPFLAVVNIRIM